MDDMNGKIPATMTAGRSESRDPVWFYAAIPWAFGLNAAGGLVVARRVPAHALLGLTGEILLAGFLVAFPPVLIRALVRRDRRA
jgi:hypothetical protein